MYFIKVYDNPSQPTMMPPGYRLVSAPACRMQHPLHPICTDLDLHMGDCHLHSPCFGNEFGVYEKVSLSPCAGCSPVMKPNPSTTPLFSWCILARPALCSMALCLATRLRISHALPSLLPTCRATSQLVCLCHQPHHQVLVSTCALDRKHIPQVSQLNWVAE